MGQLGIGAGRPFDAGALDPDIRDAIRAGISEAREAMPEAFSAVGDVVDGWQMPRRSPFGNRAHYDGDYLLRASAAMFGWGGNDLIETSYPMSHVDANGVPYDGRARYQLRLDSDPPVRAFWSVTMYDTSYDGSAGYLVENPIDRHLINSTTDGLVRDEDGRLTITMQRDGPTDPAGRANWLPTPDGPFYLTFRLYWPEAAAHGETATLEGVEWHLEGYAVDGEIGIVPWHIDATVLLEGGTVTGSSGCNRFSGSYALDGEALTFDPTVAMTRAACPEDQSAVEDGYMANLPLTAMWAIEDGSLALADPDGNHILGFEQSVIALTQSDVAAMVVSFTDLQAEIDRLDGRIDNVRIGTLRDRIKTLEAQVRQLRSTQATAQQQSGGNSTFTSAERTLLKGIPANIRSTCSPLRGNNLPGGTVAAVRCKPSANSISEMAYYLMEYPDAISTLRTVTRANNVPKGYTCVGGKAGWTVLPAQKGAEGCFVDGGKANLRLVVPAAGCYQLNVAGTRLTKPAIYVAMESPNKRIAPLHLEAVRGTEADHVLTWVTRDIPHGNTPLSPACR